MAAFEEIIRGFHEASTLINPAIQRKMPKTKSPRSNPSPS
jgi:hypothetical protein